MIDQYFLDKDNAEMLAERISTEMAGGGVLTLVHDLGVVTPRLARMA